MLHRTWSTRNDYERKINYDWPYVRLTKADLHMSHLIKNQIDGLIMVYCLLDTYIKNWKFWGCWKLRQTSSQGGSQKLLQGLMSHKLTTYLSIFNLFKLNELWSYYQKHVNQIILNRTTLWSLALQIFHSNFVDCESFLESNSPDILALCEANLDDSVDSSNFSVRGYLLLIWKDSSYNIHGLAVYVKEGLPFAWDLSLGISADPYLWLSLLHSVPWFFFPLSITFFIFAHGFWFYFI